MSLLVVGSVALDSVETPTIRKDDILGGSAVFFSYMASFFSEVSLVGAVGEDWPSEHTDLLQARKINTAGLEIVPGGKTFRWRGKYHVNMNDRDTLEVHLNVLEHFDPKVPEEAKHTPHIFLANIAPEVQLKVLDQLPNATFCVADTMDLWIEIQRDELMEVLRRVDGLVLNDSEAKMLCDDDNLVRAGHEVCKMGPKFVIIKKGEHGAMFFADRETYVLPAYPTEDVVDPTGAGDTFAGGMMGYLAECGKFDPATLKKAMGYGIVSASFNVEDFSLERLKKIERRDIEERLSQYQQMLVF